MSAAARPNFNYGKSQCEYAALFPSIPSRVSLRMLLVQALVCARVVGSVICASVAPLDECCTAIPFGAGLSDVLSTTGAVFRCGFGGSTIPPPD